MKKVRLLSIVLLSLLLGVLFVNRDKLVSFAEEENINFLTLNTVVKNGTSFLFENSYEYNGNSEGCLFIEYTTQTRRTTYCLYSGHTSEEIVIGDNSSDYWI